VYEPFSSSEYSMIDISGEGKVGLRETDQGLPDPAAKRGARGKCSNVGVRDQAARTTFCATGYQDWNDSHLDACTKRQG
jgi:hypothetical protein